MANQNQSKFYKQERIRHKILKVNSEQWTHIKKREVQTESSGEKKRKNQQICLTEWT